MLRKCSGISTARGPRQVFLRDAVPVSEVTSLRPMKSRPGFERSHLGRRRHGAVLKAVQAHAKETKGAETEFGGEDSSVFFEPFLRSFVLGLSAGAVFEAIHVSFKFLNLVNEVGVGGLMDVLPTVTESFAPLIVDDHVVAAGCWLIFYAIEVYAVLKVLERHSQNPEAAKRALRTITTLPRLMLPRLSGFKQVAKMLGFGVSPLAVGSAAATPRLAGASAGNVLVAPKPGRFGAPGQTPPPLSDPRQEPEGPEDPEEEEELPRKEEPLGEEALQRPPKRFQERRAQVGLKPGQLETGTAEFLHRQKELSSRRCYLQNFWYAAGLSENIRDKPIGVEILGEKVVLFRDTRGVIQCLHDVCPHRGAPLHMGWKSEIEGHDCIVCPYHGWAFDQEGKLRDVPAAESSNEWPQKPLVKAFPVEEKGGFIWLFHGSKDLPEDERPPIPYVPELDDPKWKPVYGEIEFDCNHWSVFENAIDMAHIHYLHSDSFGNEAQPQIRNMKCATNAFGVEASFSLHNKPVNAVWEFSKVPEVNVTAKALLPSTSVIGFTLGQGLSFITFVNTVPISAKRTINRFALVRRLDVDRIGSFVFNMSAWDSAARTAMIKILSQDKAMVERLMPEMLGREISVKADLPQMAFRKLRQQYVDMGYGVAPEQNLDESAQPGKDM